MTAFDCCQRRGEMGKGVTDIALRIRKEEKCKSHEKANSRHNITQRMKSEEDGAVPQSP